MRIGLYGMPAAGKTYILDHIDFLDVYAGSTRLKEINPRFNELNDEEKTNVRKELATALRSKDFFVMDGHYAFGDNVVFTEDDGALYDVFLYLYIDPDVLAQRMIASSKNANFLAYDIAEWQKAEIRHLRAFCHRNEKDFYVIDNPPENVFRDIGDILEFVTDIKAGYSCYSFAQRCASEILSAASSDTVMLFDGDKTLTRADSSYKVFGYTTHLFDGNYYTGYQTWKQSKEFETFSFDVPVITEGVLNKNVIEAITGDVFILTSGHSRVWGAIAKQLGIPYYCGAAMSAETKFFIVKRLKRAGKRVIAYGDSISDYYMLKAADEGYIVAKTDGSFSRSLEGLNLEGLKIVRT